MAFHVDCIDDTAKPGLRQRVRAAHLSYMIAHRDHILFGGPLKAEDGATSIGSTFALDYAGRDEVKAFLRDEPYMQAGLFSEVRIRRMTVMVPEPRPGFLEEELARERAAAGNAHA